jgi:hypothetical protein
MVSKKRLSIIVLLFVLLLFSWAPWMNSKELSERVLKEKGLIDGTIDKKMGRIVCDYKVSWVPFGRLVGSCEGIYFVTFYGKIL